MNKKNIAIFALLLFVLNGYGLIKLSLGYKF